MPQISKTATQHTLSNYKVHSTWWQLWLFLSTCFFPFQGQGLANVTGAIDYAMLIRDIANLVDMYNGDSNLFALMDEIPDLAAISEVLRKMADFLPYLTNMEDIDFVG